MTDGNQAPLRIVTFNNVLPAFEMVQHWAAQAGHTIVLTVTTPGPASRRSEGYKGIVASAPPGHDVLVTTRLRKVALPLVQRARARPDPLLLLPVPHPRRAARPRSPRRSEPAPGAAARLPRAERLPQHLRWLPLPWSGPALDGR